VATSKLQHGIREVLCAAKLSTWLVGDLTRALERDVEKQKGEGLNKQTFWQKYDGKIFVWFNADAIPEEREWMEKEKQDT